MATHSVAVSERETNRRQVERDPIFLLVEVGLIDVEPPTTSVESGHTITELDTSVYL